MLEQKEKVCKVCKAADNRGLPSRSAEHGSVQSANSPMSQDKNLGSKFKHATARTLSRRGRHISGKSAGLVLYKSFQSTSS